METSDQDRTLLLLRHAKASQADGVADKDRPLSDRGLGDARAVGRQLVVWALRCDLVLCSPALRTRQTWEQAVQGGAESDEVSYRGEIYQAGPTELVQLIRTVPDEVSTLILVGHGPGVPGLAHALVNEDPSSQRAPGAAELGTSFPTSGLARFRVTSSWAELGPGAAELVEFAVPRS